MSRLLFLSLSLPVLMAGAQFFGAFPLARPPFLPHPVQLVRSSTPLLPLPHPYDAEVQCSAGGYFRNPEDCTRFYRCVDISGGLGYYQVRGVRIYSGILYVPSFGLSHNF